MWPKKRIISYPYHEVLAEFKERMEDYLKEAMRHFPTRNFMTHERTWKHRVGQQRLFKETKREIFFKHIRKKYFLSEKEYKKMRKKLIKDSVVHLMTVWGKHKK